MDGDGSPYSEDCDDEDPDRAPTLPELCDDGIDNDCNGEADTDCQYFGGIVSREPAAEIWGAYTMGQSALSPWTGIEVYGVSDLDGDGAEDFIVRGDDRNDDYHLFVGPLAGTAALADAAYAFEHPGYLSLSWAEGMLAVGNADSHQGWSRGAVHLVTHFEGNHSAEDGFGAGMAIGKTSGDGKFGGGAVVGDVDLDGEWDLMVAGYGGDWDHYGYVALFYGPFAADVEFEEETHSDLWLGSVEDRFGGDFVLSDVDADGFLDLLCVAQYVPSADYAELYGPGARLFKGPLAPIAPSEADRTAVGQEVWPKDLAVLFYDSRNYPPVQVDSDYDSDGLPELTMLLVSYDVAIPDELRVIDARLESEDLEDTLAKVELEWAPTPSWATGPSFDVAGEPAYDDERGIAWLFFGPLSGTLTPDDAEGWLTGAHPAFEHCEEDTYACQHLGSAFGASVAGIGDNNGDGFGDLLIGAPFTDTTLDDEQHGEGAAFLFHGGAR